MGTERELRPGDVIHTVNGVSVRGLSELRSAVTRPGPGESLVFQIERDGDLMFVVLDLE